MELALVWSVLEMPPEIGGGAVHWGMWAWLQIWSLLRNLPGGALCKTCLGQRGLSDNMEKIVLWVW